MGNPRVDSRRRWALAAALLLALALGLRFAAAGREGPDRRPRPDALEYAGIAAALAAGDGYVYPLEGALLPPRYPPGAPLALAPATALRGARDAWIGAALWSSLAVLLTGLLGAAAAGWVGFWVAGAVALVSPLSVAYGGLAMSEGPVQALVAAALLGAAVAPWRRAALPPRTGALVLCGLALGWMALTRVPLLAFALAPVAAALAQRAGWVARARGALWVGLAPLLAVLVMALWQERHLGSFTRTGYHLWAPEVYVDNAHLVLSTHWLTNVLVGHWETPHPVRYFFGLIGTARDSFGGSLWAPAAALLAAVGLVVAVRGAHRCPVRRALALGALSSAVLLGFHLVYAWQDLRFLAPFVPVVAALAGVGAAQLARVLGAARTWPTGEKAVAVLAVAAVAVGPLLQLAPRIAARRTEPPSATAALAAMGRAIEDNAIVVVDVPAPLAREAFGDGRELMFADLDSADPHLVRTQLFDIQGKNGATPQVVALATLGEVDLEALARLQAALAAGRPIYWLSTPGEGVAGPALELLATAGASLQPTEHAGLLRLAPPTAPR